MYTKNINYTLPSFCHLQKPSSFTYTGKIALITCIALGMIALSTGLLTYFASLHQLPSFLSIFSPLGSIGTNTALGLMGGGFLLLLLSCISSVCYMRCLQTSTPKQRAVIEQKAIPSRIKKTELPLSPKEESSAPETLPAQEEEVDSPFTPCDEDLFKHVYVGEYLIHFTLLPNDSSTCFEMYTKEGAHHVIHVPDSQASQYSKKLKFQGLQPVTSSVVNARKEHAQQIEAYTSTLQAGEFFYFPHVSTFYGLKRSQTGELSLWTTYTPKREVNSYKQSILSTGTSSSFIEIEDLEKRLKT